MNLYTKQTGILPPVKANYFALSFIIGKTGAIEDARVIKGISEGYDAAMLNHIKKTAKDWMPATFRGQPVQTQLVYYIKYLDSIVR